MVANRGQMPLHWAAKRARRGSSKETFSVGLL